ncbi:MAG TPA: hypothetical protein PLE74_10095 [Candidatus Cloacimonadota bacterium]|nr:hypothetical protein [Candidatus Cloacimonadota bacterium]HPT72617.1 hypothetical protein [Candidatus Cloacimonadota bacterium]
MNLIDEAVSLEITTEEFYRNLIDTCDYNPEIKKILIMLAEDTAIQITKLRQLNQYMRPEHRDSDFFLRAKEIFKAMQNRKNFGVCSLDQMGVYEHVLENLQKTIAMYEDLIAQMDDERQNEILNIILQEKRKHVYLIDNIVELLRHPEQWVENGEFTHFDEF